MQDKNLVRSNTYLEFFSLIFKMQQFKKPFHAAQEPLLLFQRLAQKVDAQKYRCSF